MTFPYRTFSIAAILALMSIALHAGTAKAQVQALLKNDGDTGDPLGTYYLGTTEAVAVILGPAANGYNVASVNWSWTYTYPGCTDASPPNSLPNGSEISITATAIGTYNITANITYQAQSTNPPTTPAPNIVTGSFSIAPPAGVQLVNYNAQAAYPLNQLAQIQFQLLYGGDAGAGYNMQPEEKVAVTIPANTPPEYGGGWSSSANAPFLIMDGSGLITDGKGPNPKVNAVFPQLAAGTVFIQYTQVLGVFWVDLCGNPHDITLGTYTVIYKMADDGSPNWNCTVTAVAN